MKISLLILLSHLLVSYNPKDYKPIEKMGMDYQIFADKETTCKLDFPDGLSFFFEQIGGYGEQSEVSQVSKLLNIDLSTFQNYDYGTKHKLGEKKFWQDIIEFEKVVDGFIERINKNPNYYKQVKHNRNKESQDEEFRRISEIKDQKLLIKRLEELQNRPDYLLPADSGYLSSGRIKEDLKSLKKLIECLKKAGVKKIKLMYG